MADTFGDEPNFGAGESQETMYYNEGNASSVSNALAQFNAKFRELCEQKDAEDHQLKNDRRAAGKLAMKKLLANISDSVEKRKTVNRENEAQKEKEMMDSLEGESWGRVASLVDLTIKEETNKRQGAKNDEGDSNRMKDVLVNLRHNPLPAVSA